MEHTYAKKGLFKKAIAVTLGVTLAFSTLMLPDSMVKNELPSASAFTVEVNDCVFDYDINTENNVTIAIIKSVKTTSDTVKIPSSVKQGDKEYPVRKISTSFMENNDTVKTVIFPDSVKSISSNVLKGSSIENIEVPDALEYLGYGFADDCPNIKSVKYNGTGIKGANMGGDIFVNSEVSCLTNEKGAVCFGNWLIKYYPTEENSTLKIADLGGHGIKIENMARSAIPSTRYVETVDLEGIKCINANNFNNSNNLSNVINDDSIELVSADSFKKTPWYTSSIANGFLKLGNSLFYYKTDSNVLDLTSGKLKGIKYVATEALKDSPNIETVFCNSDDVFAHKCFYVASEPSQMDPMPLIPRYNVKYVYVDGKKITHTVLLQDQVMNNWLKTNFSALNGSALLNDIVEAKTKEIFKQLDIPYLGPDTGKKADYSPTEEFYIRLKIHDFISQYDYDHYYNTNGIVGALLVGGKLTCATYASLTQYMLECAGVESITLCSVGIAEGNHDWNATKIGDEWFVSDDGWDAQNNGHGFGWFFRSSSGIKTSLAHEPTEAYSSYHYSPESKVTDFPVSERYIGDINGDNDRTQEDVDLLWAYIRDESDRINAKASDLNFDGDITVDDALLLDQFVNGKALDPDNIPTDGYAPGFKVFFVDGDDYDNIHSAYTDRDGYITLPTDMFEAPAGKKLVYDIGKPGEKVKVHNPYQVINTKYLKPTDPGYDDSSRSENSSGHDDSSKPDIKKGILGDVNGDGAIDIEDAVAIIQHINGVTPLTADEESRADVSKDKNIDIDDAVTLISYINGNSTF